jgi:hypothetical protein
VVKAPVDVVAPQSSASGHESPVTGPLSEPAVEVQIGNAENGFEEVQTIPLSSPTRHREEDGQELERMPSGEGVVDVVQFGLVDPGFEVAKMPPARSVTRQPEPSAQEID